ncbi:hypothetical protein GCM10009619_44120 [Williamsia maris]
MAERVTHFDRATVSANTSRSAISVTIVVADDAATSGLAAADPAVAVAAVAAAVTAPITPTTDAMRTRVPTRVIAGLN